MSAARNTRERHFVMAAPLKVEFHFDFGSPNAYLAELALPEIERRTGVKFDYLPVLLGGVYKSTGNMSPADSLRGIKNKPEYNALETQRFLRRHNITKFEASPFFPVNTLTLMRGAVAAQFEGVFEDYFRAAYHQIENTSDAVARGSFGSPTFFVGNEIFFGKDSLRDVEDEIVVQLTIARRKTA
jgi:2-hydroxychromene-2-carboxylate isomerase